MVKSVNASGFKGNGKRALALCSSQCVYQWRRQGGGNLPPPKLFSAPPFCPPQFLVISKFCRNQNPQFCEKWPNVVETSELDRQNCKNL